MDVFFGALARRHFATAPITLVDIGARGGLQPNWKRAAAHLRIIGFEPDPAEHARLASEADPEKSVYINAAVHRGPAELTLNVGREGGTSSLLEPNMPFLRRFPRAERYDVVQRVKIAADGLDALLSRHAVSDVDFVKIDTQGAELPILEGAMETLSRCVGVETETLFAPLYLGQSGFGEVDALLRASGFQLFDLRHSYWKRAAGSRYGGPKGQLAFGDALYFRTEETFGLLLERLDLHARRDKLLHALSVAVLYGYVDYAIELLEAHRAALDSDLADEIDGALRADIDVSARFPPFRGRGWLSHFFYRLHRASAATYEGWASGGRNIGNVD